MQTTRRALLTGGGISLVGGCAAALVRLRDDDPDHVVVVGNVRETSHDVAVEIELDGDARTYGPREVASGGHWEVARIERRGGVTVRFRVDGDLAWEDAHEIPTVDGPRRSIVLFELEPDGEFLGRVVVED